MKHIGINEPCSENWNAMSPTDKGAFCQKCATQVYDFTNKSNEEIKQTLRFLIGQPVCGRITPAQEDSLNAEFIAWSASSTKSFQSRMVFALVVVFGLSLFSCTHEQDKKKIVAIQQSAMQAIEEQVAQTTIKTDLPEERIAPPIEQKIVEPVIPELVDLQVFQLDESVITEYRNLDEDVLILGGMSYDRHYEQFLVSEVNPVQELDENGQPFPTSFDAIVFPNPVTSETTFEFKIPTKTNFEIGLYDMNGKYIQPIHSGEIDRGTFRQQLDLSNLNPGMYLVVINSNDFKKTVRVSKI